MTNFGKFIIALIVLSLSVTAFAQDPKATAFQGILTLDHRAADAKAAEKEAEKKRQQAYQEAANAVRQYIQTWESSPTVENLRETFRLAIYLELAGDPKGAWQQYKACSLHPKLRDKNASWNNNRIEDLIGERMTATAPNSSAGGAGGGGGGGMRTNGASAGGTIPPVPL